MVLSNVYTGSETAVGGIQLLVPCHGNRANDELHGGLREAGYPAHVIGDALAPRELDLAIAEAAMVAREI